MRTVTLEELEELALSAKPDMYIDDEKDITISVEEHAPAYESAPVVVLEDGTIGLGCELGGCTEIQVAADFESWPTDEQEESLAAVIAVMADAFGVELDEEHLSLPECFSRETVVERADWLLGCGLES